MVYTLQLQRYAPGQACDIFYRLQSKQPSPHRLLHSSSVPPGQLTLLHMHGFLVPVHQKYSVHIRCRRLLHNQPEYSHLQIQLSDKVPHDYDHTPHIHHSPDSDKPGFHLHLQSAPSCHSCVRSLGLSLPCCLYKFCHPWSVLLYKGSLRPLHSPALFFLLLLLQALL